MYSVALDGFLYVSIRFLLSVCLWFCEFRNTVVIAFEIIQINFIEDFVLQINIVKFDIIIFFSLWFG